MAANVQPTLAAPFVVPARPAQAAPAVAESRADHAEGIEISIVMPCLNEIRTIAICVEKAWKAIRENGYRGEVVVADNGSTDGSVEAALAAGARVVHQPLRGYGNAYLKGFEAAQGRCILMADSDNTYDFADLPRFMKPLREGWDVVMGNRFTGKILPGAMPWHHQYIGNPVLSGLLNLFFRSGIGDAHCGMRAFTAEAWKRMYVQTTGMEFASEMVINVSKARMRMTEVPITYYPRDGESKLNSFRDGWRHLRFMLLYSPTHLYLWPGFAMMVVGMLMEFVLAFGPLQLGGLRIGFHWMFVGALLAILGYQVVTLGFFARVFSLSSHIDESRDPAVSFFTEHFTIETGIMTGLIILAVGLAPFFMLLGDWLRMGELAPAATESFQTIRWSILALTLVIIGGQTIFSSFFISMMVMKRRGWGLGK
jgi:glycosyltransferase involved in cell wall biosynthesis